jgi:hypothetical protein
LERGGISYIDARRKLQNAFSVYVLLRKNVWNGVPVLSVTKYPWF